MNHETVTVMVNQVF